LVTGASGLLGLNFALAAAQRNHAVTGLVHRNRVHSAPFAVAAADLTAPGEIDRLLDEVRPEVIVHCAAMAILDECEAQPEQAQKVNAEAPGVLARAAACRAIRLVHISTDSVFDGQVGHYAETDEPHPISVYARTKLAGERAVQAADPSALVARVNFYGWSLKGRRSLAEFFYNHLVAGQPVNGFTDVYFCPLLVNDLAEILLEMIERHLEGLYHVYSAECLSKHEFGCRLARVFGLDETLVRPVSHEEGGLLAARSPNLTMDVSKLSAALGHPLPGQDSGIRRFYELHRQGFPEQLRALFGEPV
ncbi:MAG TPA: SDR family oxidoreductase, partial [Anaerolineaceae bacterium]|nr:SDR family oxidoreductase [Anaerolineaceae bacterium]